jgi:hypothetical protein
MKVGFLFSIVVIAITVSLATECITAFAASFPGGSGSSSNSFGNPASSASTQMKNLGNQDKNATPPEEKEQKEANPILYENYQQCYASLISDVIGRPAEEFDARKTSIKKYCKAMSKVKYQKRFFDCYNNSTNSGNGIDSIIDECISRNEIPVK